MPPLFPFSLFRFPFRAIQPTLILGADVSHPPPGSGAQSIAAVVSPG